MEGEDATASGAIGLGAHHAGFFDTSLGVKAEGHLAEEAITGYLLTAVGTHAFQHLGGQDNKIPMSLL